MFVNLLVLACNSEVSSFSLRLTSFFPALVLVATKEVMEMERNTMGSEFGSFHDLAMFSTSIVV